MKLFEYKDPLFSVVHARDEMFQPCQMHTHTFAELYCILDGQGIFHVEGNQYQLSPGDILLMRPAEAHYIDVDPDLPYERLYISFDIRLLDALEPGHRLLQPYFERRTGTRNHYKADPGCTAKLLAMTAPDGSRATMIANLVLVLQRLCQLFGQAADPVPIPDTLEYRIIRYINQNLHTPLSVQELCAQFYLSRSQLCRRFREATGTSIGRYIAAKRMLLARQLLLQGQKPTEVFSRCGYQDYATFFRAYKSFFGHSPRQADQCPLVEERHIIA